MTQKLRNESYNIEAEFRIPTKVEMDLILSIINYLETKGCSEVFIKRAARQLRLDSYLVGFTIGGSEKRTHKIQSQLSRLNKNKKGLLIFNVLEDSEFIKETLHIVSKNLDFIDEGLYCILLELSDRFKESIQNVGAGKASTQHETKEDKPEISTLNQTKPKSDTPNVDEILEGAKRLQEQGQAQVFDPGKKGGTKKRANKNENKTNQEKSK